MAKIITSSPKIDKSEDYSWAIDVKTISLHKEINMALSLLIEKSLDVFSICIRNEITWNFFPLIVSQCFEIPERK